MLTIRFDPDRLSTEELTNLASALHVRCAHCIEYCVPPSCRHNEEVHDFVDALASAVDETLRVRARTANAEALGVDDSNGEWLAGS